MWSRIDRYRYNIGIDADVDIDKARYSTQKDR